MLLISRVRIGLNIFFLQITTTHAHTHTKLLLDYSIVTIGLKKGKKENNNTHTQKVLLV